MRGFRSWFSRRPKTPSLWLFPHHGGLSINREVLHQSPGFQRQLEALRQLGPLLAQRPTAKAP